MPSLTNRISPRIGLAVATAVTGLVLAGGVSIAALIGWVRPAEALTGSVQATAATNTFAPPQIVLVPVTPAATQVGTSTSSSVQFARTSSATGPANATRSHEADFEGARRAPVQLGHGERDDD